MKIFLLLLLFIPAAHADEWTRSDTYRETAYLALHVTDWLQTRTIAKNPDVWYEKNIILGSHPHVDRVDAYFILAGLAHVGIAAILPNEWRAPFQYFTIGFESGVVAHNYKVGVKVGF